VKNPSTVLFGPLYCQEIGLRDRPTLLLIHGGGASHWVWSGVLEHLTQYFHVLLPDLLEHGRSGGVFSVVSSADLLAELVATLGNGGQAHIAGLSVGAEVGLELVGRYPGLVSSALLSGPLITCPAWLEVARNPRYAGLAHTVFGAYLPLRAFAPLTFLHTLLLRIPARHRAEYFADVQRETVPGFARMVREYLNYRVPNGFEHSKVPTLLLTGPFELSAVKASVDQLAARLPNALAAMVPALEHNWLLENPALFARSVVQWALSEELESALERRG